MATAHSPPPQLHEAHINLMSLEYSTIMSHKLSPGHSPTNVTSTVLRVAESPKPRGNILPPPPVSLSERRSEIKREKTQSLMRNLEKVEWNLRQTHNVESIKMMHDRRLDGMVRGGTLHTSFY